MTLFITLAFSSKVELEILGSGGPELDGRASTSYILWIDNEAKLMVDMGSGSMLRFEESGAKLGCFRQLRNDRIRSDAAISIHVD